MKNWLERTPRTMGDWLALAAGTALLLAAAGQLPGLLRAAAGLLALLAPFGWGLVLAYVLDIPTRFFAANLFGGRRGGALAVSYALLFGVLALLAALVVPQLVQSLTAFAGRLGAYEETLRRLLAWVQATFGIDTATAGRLVQAAGRALQGLAGCVVPHGGAVSGQGCIRCGGGSSGCLCYAGSQHLSAVRQGGASAGGAVLPAGRPAARCGCGGAFGLPAGKPDLQRLSRRAAGRCPAGRRRDLCAHVDLRAGVCPAAGGAGWDDEHCAGAGAVPRRGAGYCDFAAGGPVEGGGVCHHHLCGPAGGRQFYCAAYSGRCHRPARGWGCCWPSW